nr:patatin-like phospholipase domain-containing protein 2 [Penaeus vannamei]
MGALNPFYRLEEPLMESLLKILPEDAHRRAVGRVFLSLTKASTLTNEVISQYATRDELIRAILCCCFLPCLSGYTAPIFNGRRYIDGGMSNNMPLKGPTIVSINAFSGEFEICPRDETGDLRPLNRSLNQCLAMSNENLYRLKCGLLPPEPEELDQHYHYGYFHARDFFCPSGASKVRRPVKLRMEGSGEGEGEDQERKR